MSKDEIGHPLTYLRTNMDNATKDKYPAEICLVDEEGKLFIQKVSLPSVLNLTRDGVRIMAETRFFKELNNER